MIILLVFLFGLIIGISFNMIKSYSDYWRGFHKALAIETKPEIKKASVPLMITRDMRQQLYDLGYRKAQVDQMAPIAAWKILEKK